MRFNCPHKIEEITEMSDLSEHIFNCKNPYPLIIERNLNGIKYQDTWRKTWVPCKKCSVCKNQRKKQITGRLIAESKMHQHTSFITLTYDNENCPPSLEEGYRDIQLWLKTLRNHRSDTVHYADKNKQTIQWDQPLRYYVAGELGPKADRPHWHCLLFGIPPAQIVLPHQKSFKLLSNAWNRGFITWTDASVSRIAYAACYSVKKTEEHLSFWQASRRPGLGQKLLTKLGEQAFHLGKLPQDIPSLKTGKSYWPIDATGRRYIETGWAELAEQSGWTERQINKGLSNLDGRLQHRINVDLWELVSDSTRGERYGPPQGNI